MNLPGLISFRYLEVSLSYLKVDKDTQILHLVPTKDASVHRCEISTEMNANIHDNWYFLICLLFLSGDFLLSSSVGHIQNTKIVEEINYKLFSESEKLMARTFPVGNRI